MLWLLHWMRGRRVRMPLLPARRSRTFVLPLRCRARLQSDELPSRHAGCPGLRRARARVMMVRGRCGAEANGIAVGRRRLVRLLILRLR